MPPAVKPKIKAAALTLCPEQLEPDAQSQLIDWAERTDFTKSEVRWAFNAVKEWSRSGAKRKADWVATIQTGMRRGWALEGYRETDSERYAREMANSPLLKIVNGESPDVES